MGAVKTSDFHYELPRERIAQEAAQPRDSARMLVHELAGGRTRHRVVSDLEHELERGDLLVVNDTRVIPARLYARRASAGRCELLMLGPAADGRLWRALVKPARKLAAGELLRVEGATIEVRPVQRELDAQGRPGPVWSLEVADPRQPGRAVESLLEDCGRMPLPPYIERQREADPRDELDRVRYQTVYARQSGAVAAPTAGLHFTTELLGRLERAGVPRATVTLHVGAGTFLPLAVEDPEDHRMHAERFEVPAETVRAVQACRDRGGRVVAVGTTSVRALESCVRAGELVPRRGETDLFIRPGSEISTVDGLLTNFHLPSSTLMMLVAALTGRERLLELSREALQREYRFYSYGDAMLLLP